MIFRRYLHSKIIRNILDDPHISFAKKIKISRLPNVTFTYIPCSRDVYILILYEIHLFPSFFDHIYTVRSSGIFWMTLIYLLQKNKKISRLPNVTFTYIICSREVYILILYEIHLFPSFFDHIYTVIKYTIFFITVIYQNYMKSKFKIIGLLKYC